MNQEDVWQNHCSFCVVVSVAHRGEKNRHRDAEKRVSPRETVTQRKSFKTSETTEAFRRK